MTAILRVLFVNHIETDIENVLHLNYFIRGQSSLLVSCISERIAFAFHFGVQVTYQHEGSFSVYQFEHSSHGSKIRKSLHHRYWFIRVKFKGANW